MEKKTFENGRLRIEVSSERGLEYFVEFPIEKEVSEKTYEMLTEAIGRILNVQTKARLERS